MNSNDDQVPAFTDRDIFIASGRGATVAVRDHGGGGPAVVLLHGAGLNLSMWDAVVELLAPDHRVVVVDLLGHGASTLPASYSLHADLAAVEAVIETLGLSKPAVIGHSYGGMLAVEYSATHPECPLAVNLDGLGGQGRPDHYPGLHPADVEAYWAGRLAYVDRVVPQDDAGDQGWRDSKIGEALAESEEIDARLAMSLALRGFQPGDGSDWVRRPPRPYLLSLLHTLFQLDVFSAYHRARCPVVMVVATKKEADGGDPHFLEAYHEGLKQVLAGSPRVRVARVDCGHGVPLEQPAWVADLVRDGLVDLRQLGADGDRGDEAPS
jgi:pimeloyl-ACP methyl ester carboxylesterase